MKWDYCFTLISFEILTYFFEYTEGRCEQRVYSRKLTLNKFCCSSYNNARLTVYLYSMPSKKTKKVITPRGTNTGFTVFKFYKFSLLIFSFFVKINFFFKKYNFIFFKWCMLLMSTITK